MRYACATGFRFLLLTLLVSGCQSGSDAPLVGPGAYRPAPTPPSGPRNLSGLPPAEVLRIKYTQANLICRLWSQFGSGLDRVREPNDTFTWDLLNHFAPAADFKLDGTAEGMRMSVRLNVKKLSIIDALNTSDEAGNQYKLAFTPAAEIDIAYDETISYATGKQTSSGTGARSLRERIADRTLDQGYFQNFDAENQSSYYNYVECIIQTEIRPEYRNQFQITRRAVISN